MITETYAQRLSAGLVEDGRVTGTVTAYNSFKGEVVSVEMFVTKTDVPDLKLFEVALVTMNVPRDGNFLLRDVMKGDAFAGYEAVPVGGEITFVECSLVNDRQVEAYGFDLPGMDLDAYLGKPEEALASSGP